MITVVKVKGELLRCEMQKAWNTVLYLYQLKDMFNVLQK